MSSYRSIRGFQFPVFPSGAEGTFSYGVELTPRYAKPLNPNQDLPQNWVNLLLYDEGGFETSRITFCYL